MRALIVVTNLKADGDRNVAAVAAKVELGDASATAQLLVRGYKGASLAEQLPSWQSFDVAAYGDYMKAISAMQKQVEGDEPNIVPELIWPTVNSQSMPPATVSVGSVSAYQALSEGQSFVDALRHLLTREQAVIDAMKAVYLARVGQNEQDTTPPERRDEAKQQLYGLPLHNSWFHLPGR